MSQRKRDWNERERRGPRGGGGGRFQRGSDRFVQRGRGGFGGRPPLNRDFRDPRDRDRFQDFDGNRPGPSLWTRSRRTEPELPPNVEPLRPPDLRFIDTDWPSFGDNRKQTSREGSLSPDRSFFSMNDQFNQDKTSPER